MVVSILSQLLNHKIGFKEAARQIEDWGAKVLAHAPGASDAVAQIVSDAKQSASDAISLADTAAKPLVDTAAATAEAALEAAVKAYLGPYSGPLLPLIDDGIDKIRDTVVGALHLKALELKARLAPPVTAGPGGAGAAPGASGA